MGRVAIVGDVGGHAEQLRWALGWLGARESRLPADLTVVQVGDLVDRGPDSVAVLDEVERVAGRWVQLVGNHEAQYLPGRTVFWPDPLAAAGVARLREWWSVGRFGVASAVRTAEGDELLVTHAGLTVAAWQALGEPGSAVEAAALLNERPALIWEVGAHGRDERAGPLWAESGAALHEPWMAYPGVVPFGQVHGHSALVRYTDRQWRCAGRVRQRATVDWDARHVRVRVGGRVFLGVDPCHGKSGAETWEPLVLEGATVLA
ncbi:metallophosphoesterase [Actinokineospora diospyrosa]|uniref:Calcineurin-like phosphoesterase n=1 Tax=Actinokineospora diospyrosa TaxID=103728 RepID=A0ABT1I769_9PSEU|nr:metallophosphoesterase [Actinokineospora diospyrosa]MCP2268468.1 Calcineurin-like phosphoesterase [Actinokineospora diospyrosa]